MHIQAGVLAIQPADFPRVVEVWETSVCATHHFVSEADIEIFRPMVRDALPLMPQSACIRDDTAQVAGFVAAAAGKVEMLFLHPAARGHGGGSRLLNYAIATWNAPELDVNEQNEQAVGFYRRMGFVVVGRLALDGTGKPYPLLHLRLVDVARKIDVSVFYSHSAATKTTELSLFRNRGFHQKAVDVGTSLQESPTVQFIYGDRTVFLAGWGFFQAHERNFGLNGESSFGF